MNLDGMGQTELWSTAAYLRLLAEYAEKKALAFELRANGNILAAQRYERRCGKIYNDLPHQWRW